MYIFIWNLSSTLSRKDYYTKHPDFVLNSADTSIKVTDLPFTYAVYP